MPPRPAARLILGLAALLAATGARAATYPELFDPYSRYTYTNVVDERGGRPPPIAAFNSIDFSYATSNRVHDPLGCSRCPKGEVVRDRFAFDVESREGGPRIAGISASLDMTTILQSFDPVVGVASIAVTGALRVSVWETSAGPIDPIDSTEWLRAHSTGGDPKLLDGWLASVEGVAIDADLYGFFAAVDLDKLLRAHDIEAEARGVSVSLELERRARHVGAGQALIGYTRGGGPVLTVDNWNRCSLCPRPEPKSPPLVPEPSTALLLGCGLAALGSTRRAA